LTARLGRLLGARWSSEQRLEHARLDRLAVELLAARVQRAALEVLLRQPRDRDELRVLQAGLEPELARDVVALEVRQADVEDDDVGTERARDVDRGHAVDGELHLVAHHLDQQRHGVHRVEVVLDHEDAALGRGMGLDAMESGHCSSPWVRYSWSPADLPHRNPVAGDPRLQRLSQKQRNFGSYLTTTTPCITGCRRQM